MLQSRIPFVFGMAFTTMGLVIGCFAARVSTVICVRNIEEQQGICRSEQSALFLPWNKQIKSFQLDGIQKAESIELGAETYTVVLRSRNNLPDSSLYQSEYSENSQQLAREINSFLNNPEAEVLRMREGGGITETIVLLSFCGFGLLLAWQGAKVRHHSNSEIELGSK